MSFNWRTLRVIDWSLIILALIFVVLGISIIYSLTYYSSSKLYISQIEFAVVGFILMILMMLLDYRQLKASSKVIYIVGIALLILVLVLGKQSFGASRWIDLKIFDLQPSELFKLILVIVMAGYLQDKVGKLTIKHFFTIALICVVPIVFVMLQPDLGTVIVFIVIILSMLLFAKLSTKQMIVGAIIVALAIPTGWSVLKDYQKQRLMVFLNPSHDPYGAGYNISQSLITVGSGGLLGRGFGRGPQSQLNFLPVAHTDFVFAGVCEAIGFVGAAVLLLMILVFVSRIFNVANVSKDNFGSLVAVGIGSMIFFQSMINIGMNIGLMPVTGIPLPFISYGGSSLVVMLMSVGILQSIYFRHKKITFR